MKLLRYGTSGKERLGILDSTGSIRDLSGVVPDIAGDVLSPGSLALMRSLNISDLPLVPPAVRLGPCVTNVGKFICIGLNYSDHAAESGMAVPSEPVVFMKATSAICGPNDDIVMPRGATKVDWEVELGVVIGKEAKYVSEQKAGEYIAGYCVVHDVSERAFQLEGTGQWVKGKSADTFGPLGPWLVTTDGRHGRVRVRRPVRRGLAGSLDCIRISLKEFCFRRAPVLVGPGFFLHAEIYFLGNSHQNSHSPKIKMAANLAASHLIDFIV